MCVSVRVRVHVRVRVRVRVCVRVCVCVLKFNKKYYISKLFTSERKKSGLSFALFTPRADAIEPLCMFIFILFYWQTFFAITDTATDTCDLWLLISLLISPIFTNTKCNTRN